MVGWIKLHRRLKNWEWYTEKNMVQVFIHFMLKCNHESKYWRGTEIKQGQFVSSYSNLAQETGLSVQEIRTCITKMKSTGELTSKSTNKYSVFSLNSWFLYQNDIDTNKQDNNLTNKQSNKPPNKRSTTTKEDKKKEERNKSVFVFPEDEISEEWANWFFQFIEDRKDRGQKMTERAKTMLYNKLKKYNEYDRSLMLQKAIENGWKSVYELTDKDKANIGITKTPQKTIDERIEESSKADDIIQDMLDSFYPKEVSNEA